MRILRSLTSCYIGGARLSVDWLGPTVLLLMRVWVAIAFWHAGVVKIEDPTGTQFLFNTVYQVPLLPPDFAAVLGTWIELITPWLIVLGVAGRPTALFLFVYNAIAVISYPDLWPHGFWAGLFDTTDFADHKVWGLMLLAMVAWGAGRWSVDALVGIVWRWKRSRDNSTA
ncbi:MAG: DoxX family protein [Xanthomonadaceae bacterium]|nr:DoxX family protein [Xanthomonadaceae bacterium]MDE2278150.1 DoxX family protein [Xanthomonadaceae bacterium]MDE2316526.1 DoxX family protein [Xanthomonadaceae bacterium]